MKLSPKFNIGDIVMMRDTYHFNPCSKTTSIGKIEAIHFHQGTDIFGDGSEGGGNFTYSISGFSLQPAEHKLKLYSGEPFSFKNLK